MADDKTTESKDDKRPPFQAVAPDNNTPQFDQSLILMIFSRKSRDFSHGMDRLTQRPFGRFFFWSALYF